MSQSTTKLFVGLDVHKMYLPFPDISNVACPCRPRGFPSPKAPIIVVSRFQKRRSYRQW